MSILFCDSLLIICRLIYDNSSSRYLKSLYYPGSFAGTLKPLFQIIPCLARKLHAQSNKSSYLIEPICLLVHYGSTLGEGVTTVYASTGCAFFGVPFSGNR